MRTSRFLTMGQRVKVVLLLLAVMFVFGSLHLFYGRHLISDTGIVSTSFSGICEVYSMVLGFTIFLTWQQFDRISALVMQEAGALDNVLHFSRRLEKGVHEKIFSAVRRYVTEGAAAEWKAMANGKRSRAAESIFSTVHNAVLSIEPRNDKESTIFHHLMRMLEQAGTFRDERLALGVGHVPRSMLLYVYFIAGSLLTLLALHASSTATELVASGIFAAVSVFGVLVIHDLDNPFTGAWSISAQPLEDVVRQLPEGR